MLRLNLPATTHDSPNRPPTVDKHAVSLWHLARVQVYTLLFLLHVPGGGEGVLGRTFALFTNFLLCEKNGVIFVPLFRITSSAFLAPAKAAAWMGKWPSLFCMQSLAPCFSLDKKGEGWRGRQTQSILCLETKLHGAGGSFKEQLYNLTWAAGQLSFTGRVQLNRCISLNAQAPVHTNMLRASQLLMEQASIIGVFPRSPCRLLSVVL